MPVLYRQFFQLGYVLRNLDGAMATLKRRMGVKDWKVHSLPLRFTSEAGKAYWADVPHN